jgi:cation diffusion facilitator family transporter
VQDGSKKAITAAFFANLGIAVAKFVGFLITGSAGLLAEAAHSFADTGNQALLMLGAKRSRRPPTQHHQFGFGTERYFWAFVVALVLFTGGGMFALYEGIQKLIHPHAAENIGVAIVILLAAVALESYSLSTAIAETKRLKPADMSYWRFVRTAKQPELPVVLLEDVGAEIGLLLALFGVVMTKITDNARWDALGSIAIGVLLGVIAVILAVRMKALLIGESATSADQSAVVDAITSAPLVNRLIHIRTQHLGPEELLVAAKVEFARDLSMAELAAAVDGVERAVRSRVPTVGLIYIEPDLYRGAPA